MLILVLVPALPCLRDSTRINPGRSWESKEHWHRCPVLAEAASPASASGCWANSSRGFHTLLETKKKSGVSERRKKVAGVQHRQRCRPEHWIGTPQLSFGAAALLRLYSTWTNRDPAAAARMSVRLTMRVLFIRNLARSIPAARQMSLLLASSMQRTARSSKKFFHRRRNVRPFASSAYLFGWDISASEWDLQGHRLHLSSQCSDRQIICHTIATAIASSSLATHVSAVSELWSSEQICYRSD
jgi:hypothetical protein